MHPLKDQRKGVTYGRGVKYGVTPVYNPEFLNTIKDSSIDFTISDSSFLEVLLLQI